MQLTRAEHNTRFNLLLQRGFQAGDTALMFSGKPITPTVHPHSQRPCVYVQLDCVIDLTREPTWLINPHHYRGGLVCYLPSMDPVISIRCLERWPRSAKCQKVT